MDFTKESMPSRPMTEGGDTALTEVLDVVRDDELVALVRGPLSAGERCKSLVGDALLVSVQRHPTDTPGTHGHRPRSLHKP